MEIPALQARPATNFIVKGEGPIFDILNPVMGHYYPTYHARTWKGWHTGFIVKILPDGTVITFQAFGAYSRVVTYESIELLEYGPNTPKLTIPGEPLVKFYHWVDAPQDRIDKWVLDNEGRKYSNISYPCTFAGGISQAKFNVPVRVCFRSWMCWECMSNFDRDMGRPLQPLEQSCVLAVMQDVLEGV